MKTRISFLAFLLLGFLGSLMFANTKSVNKSFTGLAIKGFDPVAYFTEKKPVKGDKAHRFEWHGANWDFSSAANLNAFKAAPEKYAPQYGGYCAWAMADGKTAGINPKQWTVLGGKLYLNYNADIQKKWTADRANLITKADAAWQKRSGK